MKLFSHSQNVLCIVNQCNLQTRYSRFYCHLNICNPFPSASSTFCWKKCRVRIWNTTILIDGNVCVFLLEKSYILPTWSDLETPISVHDTISMEGPFWAFKRWKGWKKKRRNMHIYHVPPSSIHAKMERIWHKTRNGPRETLFKMFYFYDDSVFLNIGMANAPKGFHLCPKQTHFRCQANKTKQPMVSTRRALQFSVEWLGKPRARRPGKSHAWERNDCSKNWKRVYEFGEVSDRASKCVWAWGCQE